METWPHRSTSCMYLLGFWVQPDAVGEGSIENSLNGPAQQANLQRPAEMATSKTAYTGPAQQAKLQRQLEMAISKTAYTGPAKQAKPQRPAEMAISKTAYTGPVQQARLPRSAQMSSKHRTQPIRGLLIRLRDIIYS